MKVMQFGNGKIIHKTKISLLVIASWGVFLASAIAREESPQLKALHAECTREGINVQLIFKKPFAGVAYSNGHYETAKCRYITQDEDQPQKVMGPSGTNFSFLIPMNECGTTYYGGGTTSRNARVDQNENEVYIENTLLIQSDPTIQESGDLAKTLRCVWQKEIHQPLMASLPFGNMPFKMHKRIKTVTAAMNHSAALSQENNSNPKHQSQFNFRIQKKKGQVQSVSLSDRRQYSRALESEEEDKSSQEVMGDIEIMRDDESGEPSSTETFKEGVISPLALTSSSTTSTYFRYWITMLPILLIHI